MSTTPPDWQRLTRVAQLVRKACACFRRDACTRGRPCRLLQSSPDPCAYLEESLLPAAPGSVVGDYATRVGRTATEKGATLIRAWLGGVERLCECGAPLPPRRRMCDGCRGVARRGTKRRAQARWRRGVGAAGPV